MNCLFAQGIWKSYTVEDGLAQNNVWCIRKDLKGNMWFGTSRGLSKLDTNGVWTTYLTEYVFLDDECWVMDIEVDSINHKWMTVGGIFEELPDQLVVEFDDTTFTLYDPAENAMQIQEPTSVGIDSAGSIWVGMRDNYAWQYDGHQWLPFYVPGTRMYDMVRDIKTDRHGMLYFVHDAGVSTLEGYIWPGVDTWIEMRRVAFDRQNRMWCASWSSGLRMLNFETYKWTVYTPPTLLADECKCIAIDSINAVWIGFYNGVQRFDGNSWLTFNIEDGLASNAVWDIFVEPNGDIWFGTGGGVSVFHDTTQATQISATQAVPHPKQFILYQNFPNPFNSITRIRYEIKKSERVRFCIYNTNAQVISIIVDEFQHSGVYELTWDAKDKFGKEVSSGIYYGVLQVGAERVCQKLVHIG